MKSLIISSQHVSFAAIAGFLGLSQLCGAVTVSEIDFNNDGTKNIMMENSRIRVVVSERGGKIVSLYNKMAGREDAKIFYPREGVNQLRCEGLFHVKTSPLNDGKNQLHVDKAVDSATVTAEICADITVDAVKTGQIKVVRRYTMIGNSTCLLIENYFENTGSSDINFMPWLKHLLRRGETQPASVSFMTGHGIFYSEQLIPGRGGKKFTSTNLQYFPAANWTSRTVLPLTQPSDTVTTVTNPSDIFKIYSWRKPTEDFMTQETVFKPVSLKPGESSRFKYALTVTAPLIHVGYCSPLVNVSVSPHPTGIDAKTDSLTISLAVTEPLDSLQIKWRLLNLSSQKGESDFIGDLTKLRPEAATDFNIRVRLEENTNYELLFELYKDGIKINPGTVVDDSGTIAIPLVVGTQDTSAIVFKDRTSRDNVFKKVEPRLIRAPLVLDNDFLSAYSQSPGERCFRQDGFIASGTAPIALKAAANEYESAQVVLIPKTGVETEVGIEASLFHGPGQSVPRCESINSFLYAETALPSCFNATFPIGEYPEALLPVKKIMLQGQGNFPLFMTWFIPEDCLPGVYTGEIILRAGGRKYALPVSITVWAFALPKAPLMTVSADMKEIPQNAIILDENGRQCSQEEIYSRLVDMHLKYGITPSSLAKDELFRLDADAFEKKMRKYLDMGATMVFLGTTPDIIKTFGEEKIRKMGTIIKDKKMFGRFYVRLAMDEASEDKIPEIRRRCEEWRKNSSIPIMETYYYELPEALYGHINIYARSFSNAAWIKERMKKGDRFWRGNAIPTWLEPSPWLGRRLYWEFFEYNYTGTYIWTIKNWRDILDWGKDWWSDNGGANLASTLIWHHPTGLLSTIRLEALRSGIEDNTMLQLLRRKCMELDSDKNLSPDLKDKLQSAKGFMESINVRNINSSTVLEDLRDTCGDMLSELNTLSATR